MTTRIPKARPEEPTRGGNFFKKFKFYIGIDCGKSTGFAVWDSRAKKYTEISTRDFWDVIGYLQGVEGTGALSDTCIVVEDPNLIKSLYARHDNQDRAAALKIAQNVGGVKRETELMVEFLEKNRFNFVTIKPTASKMRDADRFKQVTGYDKQTSQHGRDAALLVFGR